MSSSFQQLVSCIALHAFPHLPHCPVVVTDNKKTIPGLFIHLLAVYTFQSSPLHSRNYVRTSLRTLIFHSAFISCIHLSTAPLRQFPSFPFRKLHSYSQSLPKPFSTAFSAVCFYFQRRAPMRQQRQSCKKLHLIGGVFSYNANSEIMPRKPLITFIRVYFQGVA